MRNTAAMLTSVAMLGVGLSMAGGVVWAQEGAQATEQTQPARQAQPRWVAFQPFNLEFEGGTLADLIGQVERAAPGQANIVVNGPADRVQIEPLTLRNVDVRTALDVVVLRAVEGPGETPASPYRLTVRSPERPLAPHATAVFIVDVIPRPGSPFAQRSVRRETEVISLRELLDPRMTAETVLSAIEAALTADPDSDLEATVFRFHEPSSLLIVRGEVGQLHVVRQVIEQLREGAERRRAEAELEEVREAIEHFEGEVSHLETQYWDADKRVSFINSQFSIESRGDIPEFQQRQRELQTQRAAAQADMTRLRTQISDEKRRLQELLRRERELRQIAGPGGDRLQELQEENARLRQEIQELRAQLSRQDPESR
jgi:hypothetical protein